jgi:hypothetical protein
MFDANAVSLATPFCKPVGSTVLKKTAIFDRFQPSTFDDQPHLDFSIQRDSSIERRLSRAEHQAATRQKIVDATIEVHESSGPGATSSSEIAERAALAE